MAISAGRKEGKPTMAMDKAEVMDWLQSVPDGARIAINDDGMALVVVGDEENYCEVGMVPTHGQSVGEANGDH